jgi:hypothetical protein
MEATQKTAVIDVTKTLQLLKAIGDAIIESVAVR